MRSNFCYDNEKNVCIPLAMELFFEKEHVDWTKLYGHKVKYL
jgi:hypothetical protein